VPEAVARTLADRGRPDRGPTLLVVSGVHGNEPAGVEASRRVAARLAGRDGVLTGRVVFVVGNRAALARGLRFVDRDLNRAWSPERVAALRNGHDLTGCEDREQRALMDLLDRLVAEAGGPVYAVDLHTTSGDGGAFSSATDTLQNRALALTLPVPFVLGLDELLDGTLLDYLQASGCRCLAFESGQHSEPLAVERAEAAVWILLVAAGLLPETAVPELTSARKLLAREGRRHPRVVEMRYRHPVEPEDGFLMRPGYRNFQRIQEGEVLATDRSGPIRAAETARILMPLYQVLGDDGFFVVREVAPFWLHVSRGMRQLRLGRAVHWLPGVSRHPDRDDALVVDGRVTRRYALRLLHLLGYRSVEEDEDRLVVERDAPAAP
jgi:succinylglutamate desuccinylase